MFKIHWLMAALPFTKSLSLVFHAVCIICPLGVCEAGVDDGEVEEKCGGNGTNEPG